MKTMIKWNTAFCVTFIVLAILSYVEEIFQLHIPMFKWVYSFSQEERTLYRIQMVLVPIFYLFVLLPMMKRSRKKEQ